MVKVSLTNQTLDYVVLKPLYDKIKDASSGITKEDIHYIIKKFLEEKLRNTIDVGLVEDIVNDYIDSKRETIEKAIHDCIMSKLGGR